MADIDMDIENIIWNETEFKLKFVLDNPNFNLPQIVRVVQGHMVDEDDSIASGQILTLHGKRKLESFVGIDGYGKDVNISANCPYRVKVVSLGHERRFTSVNELCFCENPPKFIKIVENLRAGDDTVLEADSTMEILDHILTENGDVIGINCRLDFNNIKETKIPVKEIVLPVNLNAIFLETISMELANKSFLLSELPQEFKLPLQVQFLPVTERNCGYGPQLGDITLEKKLSINSILATSVIESVRHAMTFSADLPITIQVVKGLVDNHPIQSSQQNSVDLKRFDYLSSTTDPYSNCTIQDIVYDDLKTPLIPRRDPKQRNNSSFSNYSGYSLPSSRSLHASSFSSVPPPPLTTTKQDKNIINDSKKRDLGKDIKDLERFVKSRFSFKNLKKFKKSKDKTSDEKEKDIDERDFDTQSTRTFITSDDGNSSTGICSIDIRSNGSDSTYNTSFTRIAECMDALSLDAQMVPAIPRRTAHSRHGSSDSGICLSGRKQNRSRSRDRSRSRLTPDAPSSNPSDTTFDNLSEWSLPVHLKDSPMSERKSVSSQKTSASYLWGAEETNDTNNNNNNSTNNNNINIQKTEEFKNTKQNFMAINYSTDGGNNNVENTQDIVTPSPLNTAHVKSIEEIRTLNEEGVCRVLELLKLEDYKEPFQNNQINGELLLDLEQEDLVNELKLSLFQAKKIIKYIKGWRPESQHVKPSETSRRNSLNPRDWSENDVYVHMMTINLIELGCFCKSNQVNGDLLLDILDKDTMISLKNDHNVNMSNLESKKLLNFVVKGWRPDSSPKKTAAI